jgi:MFS family permease
VRKHFFSFLYMTNNTDILDNPHDLAVASRGFFKGKFFNTFPAFEHVNYRFWFVGQTVSLIGTWIQMVAQGWLVLQLTDSAFWVGMISALGTLPVLFFSLFGGVVVDRFSRRKILFIAESFAMVLAVVLGILTLNGHITIYQVAVLSFLLGIVSAVDMPARLAFAVEMVGKRSLSSALALNAATFNGARVIGPGIAGALIAAIGLGGAFLINGLSFLSILIALFFIRVKPHVPHPQSHPLRAISDGIQYAYSHPMIKSLLIFVGVTSIFGWSYAVILPVIVKRIFHMDAAGLGYFNAVAGLGAVVGTMILSAYSGKISHMKFIIGGSWLFASALILFSFTDNPGIAMFLLFFVGLGLIMQFSTINATIQHMVEDRYRGRVMSIYTLMFLGLSPFGGLQIGYLSELVGTQMTIRIGAIIVLLYSTYIYFNQRKTRS